MTHVHSGKVRDTHLLPDGRLLMVATDRISAFDHPVGEIPNKGQVLTEMSYFWFKFLADIVPNHLTDIFPEDVVEAADAIYVVGRSMVVEKLRPIPFEAVVRGYIVGSGWTDYQSTGEVCGIQLPPGLQCAEKISPIFTPATKAPAGEHDKNVSFEYMADEIGHDLACRIREVSFQLYNRAAQHADERGIIIADTKFEFGIDPEGQLVLMDEVLTPDSSRFWPKEKYCIGQNPPSYDKQGIRDWLTSQGWTGQNPNPPTLPPEVIKETAKKYAKAYSLLCT